MATESVIFLHIQKTGGTTLHSIVSRQYPKSSVCTLNSANIDTSIREGMDKFKNRSEQERLHLRCLKGHMSFGLHEYMLGPATYFTFLRHPVDRIISLYYWVLTAPRNPLYSKVVSTSMTLEEFVTSGISSELDNGQTRLLTGVKRVDSVYGHEPISSDMLELVKQNIKNRFAVVGLIERFDESLVLLRRRFGWGNILYVKRRVARARPSLAEISSKTIELIKRHHELDIELYQFASQRFEAQIRQQGQSFQRELRNFERMNQIYPYFWRGYKSSRRVAGKVKRLITARL